MKLVLVDLSFTSHVQLEVLNVIYQLIYICYVVKCFMQFEGLKISFQSLQQNTT